MLDRFFVHGTVDVVDDLTPRTRRIRIVGDALRGLDWTPGQHVRVLVGDLRSAQNWLHGLRDTLRTYSVWDHDPAGRLELCVLDHDGDGPGVRWARAVRVGHRVAFTRPEGRLVLADRAPYHVFVGDETAAVAFGAMLRALPGSARVHGIVEVDGPEDHLPLSRAVVWVHRTAGSSVTDAVRALELPDEPGVAYVAGEARACQAVRRHLVRERGWSRKEVVVKAFWAPGKRGLD
ncbi:siderophore-interacting protein [Actinophytocola sp. KF-1]